MSSNSGDGAGLTTSNGVNTIQGSVSYNSGNPAFNISSFTGGTLNIQGAITLTIDATNRFLFLGGTSTASNTISGVIGHTDTATRILPVTKQNSGTWVLSGTNTYTGITTISGGTLVVQNKSALGKIANGTTVNGGTLDLGGTMALNAFDIPAEVITIYGTGVGGNGALVNNGSNDQTNAVEQLVLGDDATVGGTKRWDIRGTGTTFDMAGKTLTKTGTNFIGMVGASTAGVSITNPGNVIVNQGELNLHYGSTFGTTGATNSITVNYGGIFSFYQSSAAHASTLNLNNGSTLRGMSGSGIQNTWAGPVNVEGEVTFAAEAIIGVNGPIAGTANLTKTGSSTLTLSGANTFTGTTTVNTGTLKIDCTNDTSKLDNTAALNLTAATLDLSAGDFTEVVGSVNLLSGNSNITRTSNGSAVLQMNAITRNAGAMVHFAAEEIATTDTLNTNGIIGPWATVATLDGTSWAVNSTNGADGPITGLANYTYTLNAGNIASNYAAANISVDSDQTLDGAATPNSLRFNNAAANTLTLTATNTLANGGILVTNTVGDNLSTLAGGSLTGPSGGDLLINQQNTANALLISSQISNNGTTNLVKTGAGRAILSGANTYTGTTSIRSGTLQSTKASALASTASIDVTYAGSALTVNYGGTNDYSAAEIPPLLAKTTFGTSTAFIFDTSNATESVTYGNPLSIAAGVTKIGAGTLILNQANSYTGTLTANVGTLILTGDNTNATGTTSVFGGATLQLAHANAVKGNLTLATNSILNLRADANTTFSPASITASGNTLNFNVDASSTGTNKTLTLSGAMTVGTNYTPKTLHVTGGNGYALTLGNISDNNNSAGGNNDFTINATTAKLTMGTFTVGSYGTRLKLQGTQSISFASIILNSNGNNTVTIGSGTDSPIVTISAATTKTGGTSGPRPFGYTLNLGATFNINHAGVFANPTSTSVPTFVINGGTLNNTSAAAITLTAGTYSNPIQTWSGDFAFTGTKDLNLGTGAVSLGSNPGVTRKVTVNSGTLTVGGIIADGTDSTTPTVNITKDGAGTLALTGINTYTGNTTVVAGTLSLGNGNANTSLANTADVTIAAGAKLNLNFTSGDTTADTVSRLFLGSPAVQVPAGTYNSSHPTFGSYFSGTGSLIVTNGPLVSDYDTWGSSYNLSTGSETGDLDGDGLTNFEEYAFGLIPNNGASVNPFIQPLNKTTGIFKYTRRATTGVTYTYESSTTLSGAWNSFTPDSATSNNASPTEVITVDVPNSLLTNPNLFIRIKAQ